MIYTHLVFTTAMHTGVLLSSNSNSNRHAVQGYSEEERRAHHRDKASQLKQEYTVV